MIDAGRLGEKSEYQVSHAHENLGWCRYKTKRSNNPKNC